jgi:hypothetical protein
MIARILKGESPAKMPFYRLVTTKTKLASDVAPDSTTGGAAKPK